MINTYTYINTNKMLKEKIMHLFFTSFLTALWDLIDVCVVAWSGAIPAVLLLQRRIT